jgi:HEAT repeat protein
VKVGQAPLRAGLRDESPYVRLVSAQALAQYGEAADLQSALDVLGELAPPEKHNVLVSIAALNAIDALGKTAAPLLPRIRAITGAGPSPDARYDSYVPRLVADITKSLGGEPPPATPQGKGKAKAKSKANQKADP